YIQSYSVYTGNAFPVNELSILARYGYIQNMNYYAREFSVIQRLTSRVSQSLNFPYTCRRGLARGLKRRGGLGFLPGGKPTPEENFLRSLDLSGKTVFDIGGFHGLMTIFFASHAERVVAYEPLPASRARIMDNVTLNGFRNVILRSVAVGAAPGELKLVYDNLMTGGASGDPEIARELDSSAQTPQFEVVPLTTIDQEIAGGQPAPDFVKIDVEGMESDVLSGMRDLLAGRKPWLYIELHGTTPEDKQKNAQDVIDTMRQAAYEVYDVEQGRVIGRAEPITGKESHVFGK
ncbi:MAG TPA: FkbM family methyltransferase, partial [Bryobacteraceae bacterium]|nr:FkbM family methyltransferase [Bryobacteraceae bacterium]